MSYNYTELITILNAAEAWFKHQIDIWDNEEAKQWRASCIKMKQELIQSKAIFFKIEEDNPF